MGYTKRGQMPSLWKILQGSKHPRAPWHGWERRTYSMLLSSPTAPTNSHPPWHMEGTDVLDTEILHWTQQCFGTPVHFPSALSPEAHAEWGLYKILEYMGLHEILPKNRAKLRKDIEAYRHWHIYSPQTGRPRLWQGREIMCIPGIHESHGHK